jgi:DNA-binding NarL/FixJ family response regulator
MDQSGIMSSPVDDLRVLLVADDPLTRTGLAVMLQDQPGCTVAGQIAGDADQLAALDDYRPDVLLWDLGWNPESNLDHLADLKDDHIPVVVLLSDETYAVDALTAGARGLLLRNSDAAILVAALEAVARGLTVVDPELVGTVLPSRDRTVPAPVEELTPRERHVLQLLAEGLPNKAIADRLSISQHTVKFHVTAIMSRSAAPRPISGERKMKRTTFEMPETISACRPAFAIAAPTSPPMSECDTLIGNP